METALFFMNITMCGKQSVRFERAPVITTRASVVGKKEGDGPLGKLFDEVYEDPMLGKNTWEEAESALQEKVVGLLLDKAKYKSEDIRFILSGDLLGQLIASSFGVSGYDIPLIGLYGACSTMGEAIGMGAMLVAGGAAEKVISMTSSHFASAEKQFRFPLEYGNQRPLSATWTVTGSGGVIIERGIGNNAAYAGKVCIKAVTIGKIVDYGVKDSFNMGACMAPACADLIYNNFKDLGVGTEYYDKVFTGDLGYVGKRILIDLLKEKGLDISNIHSDCGMIIYDQETQDTHAGGSGCGCAATTLCAYILRLMEEGELNRVLFVPTGALLSTVSFNEGRSIPGIAHGVVLERI